MQQLKRRQKTMYVLLAAQIAVFLLLGGAVATARTLERRALHHSAVLAQQLAEVDRAPILLAEAIRAAQDNYALTAAFIDAHFPLTFNPDWLLIIIESVPDNIYLESFDFSGGTITLTATAKNLYDIGLHQQWLQEIEYFSPVLLGSINRLEDGYLRYELRIGVFP